MHVGSTAAGRQIARAGARSGAKVLLENGGNDALVIDEDVDPGWAAAQAALGAFANAGQICVSVERIYVHAGIADAFLAALTEQAGEWAARIGPLVDAEHRVRVHGHVAGALTDGACLLAGGIVPDGPGCFYRPRYWRTADPVPPC